MNSSLTLLLATKDRPHFFARWVDWAVAENCPFPVIVADGSSPDNSQLMEFHVKRGDASGLKISYFQFRPDNHYSDYLAKMRLVIREVDSPHIALVADDDFSDFASLEKLDGFLSSNADYAAVAGEVIDFHLLPHNPLRRVRDAPVGTGIAVSTRWHRHCSLRQTFKRTVADESLSERWKRSDLVFPWESVMRLDVAAETFRIAAESEVFTPRQEAIIMRLVCLAIGKFAVIEPAVVMRQDNSAGSAGEQMIHQHPTRAAYSQDPRTSPVEKQIAQKLMEFVIARQKLGGVSPEKVSIASDIGLDRLIFPEKTLAANVVKVSFPKVRSQWRRRSMKARSVARGRRALAIQISRGAREQFSEGFTSRLQAFLKNRH